MRHLCTAGSGSPRGSIVLALCLLHAVSVSKDAQSAALILTWSLDGRLMFHRFLPNRTYQRLLSVLSIVVWLLVGICCTFATDLVRNDWLVYERVQNA